MYGPPTITWRPPPNMLSVASQESHSHHHPHHHHHQQQLPPQRQQQAQRHSHQQVPPARHAPHRAAMPHREDTPVAALGRPTSTSSHGSKKADAAVAQALEIARDSPDGASDPTVSKILDESLRQIWSKVQSQPGSYVMSRDEFSVFNFFQHRFVGDKDAIAARKRYWDNRRA